MAPFNQMRSASGLLAQRTTERVVDLIVHALDPDELVQQVDVNALLKKVDVNSLLRQVDVDVLLQQIDVDALLSRVDLNAAFDRVDVNRLLTRIDMEAIAQQTDIAAVFTMSSGSVANQVADAIRGQAVALDRRIDRWVRRLLRRKGNEPMSPPAPLNVEAGT